MNYNIYVMEKYIDLHCHSNFSDGTLSPTQVVELAKQQGLSAVALTDHNTSLGLKEFMEAGKENDIIAVPGCEFTTEWNQKEIHIVGLFFEDKYWSEIEDFLELSRIAKANSNKKLIENLNAAGYDITVEEAESLSAGEYNRSHIARILLQKGYVSSVSEAFDTLLKEGKGYYFPAKRITSVAAINFIKTFGAVSVLAHPFLSLTLDELLEFIPLAKEAGLNAMETLYSEFNEEETQLAVSLANQFDLKQSGGSDFHGTAKPTISLGKGKGNLAIPFSFYENLLASSKQV